MIVSCFDALDQQRAISATLLYLRFGLAGVFMVWVLSNARSLALLRVLVLAFCAFWTIDACIQAIVGFNLFGFPLEGAQLKGIFHPRLQLGLVLTLFVPLILDSIAQPAQLRPAWWLCLVPLVVVIGMTLHRNSWLLLIVGSAMFLVYRFHDRGWRPPKLSVFVGVAVVVLASAALLTQPFIKTRLEKTVGALFESSEQLEAQLGQRPDIWRTGLNMLEQHWFNGIGPRGFRGAYASYAGPQDYWQNLVPPTSPSHPHQLALEIAIETGVLGAIGYVCLLFWLLRRYRQLDRAARVNAGPWLICALLAFWPLNIHKALYGYFFSTLAWWVLAAAIAAMYPRPFAPSKHAN